MQILMLVLTTHVCLSILKMICLILLNSPFSGKKKTPPLWGPRENLQPLPQTWVLRTSGDNPTAASPQNSLPTLGINFFFLQQKVLSRTQLLCPLEPTPRLRCFSDLSAYTPNIWLTVLQAITSMSLFVLSPASAALRLLHHLCQAFLLLVDVFLLLVHLNSRVQVSLKRLTWSYQVSLINDKY